MSCCKLHLHAHWVITALVKVMKQQEILLPFENHNPSFNIITSECVKHQSTYISWDCTKDKKSSCKHISNAIKELGALINISDETVTTLFTDFKDASLKMPKEQ